MFLTRFRLNKISNLVKRSKYNFFDKKEKTEENIENQKKGEDVIEMPNFHEDELKELSDETLIKGYLPLKNKMPETYNIFKKQIEFMGKEQELYQKLKKEMDILKKVNDDNHQKLVMMVSRIQASEKETESVKNRLTLQIEKERNYAIQKFAENALEILDNFDRCISVLDEKNEEHQQILKSDFFEGVKMTYNSTKNIFKRNKIQEMEGLVGTVADFDKHEAIFVTAYPGKQDNEIVIVSQKGYTIGERVLRTAKVGVVKNN